jgi:hypothetical protein
MGSKVTIAYYSTTQGVTQQQTGGSMVYHGKIFKIHKPLFDEEVPVEFDKEIGELVAELQEKGLEPLLDIDQCTIERYETWDTESGDVWVMYRVPCAQKDSKA